MTEISIARNSFCITYVFFLQELRKRKKLFHLGGAYQAVVTEYKEENEHLSLSRIGKSVAWYQLKGYIDMNVVE